MRPFLHKPENVVAHKPTLQPDQIRAILLGIPVGQERLYNLILAVTGVRMGEGLALRWMNFDEGKREIMLEHLQNAMDDVGIERVKSQHGFHIYRHTAARLLFDK